MIMNMVGGGASLNFKIVGGTVQPEKPSENTIWVNTDVKITDEVLSGVEPASPAEGSVWVETGTEGEIVFSAVKNKAIQIHPLSAKQYISGVWVDKTAQIFQGGEWKDWIDWGKWIVKDGKSKLAVTGVGKGQDPSFTTLSRYTITEEDGYIQFDHTTGCGIVYFDPVNLTDATTLTIEGAFKFGSYKSDFMLLVWTNIGEYVFTNMVKREMLSETGATVDVSDLTGEYYVGFSTRGSGTQKVTNFLRE